MEYTNLHGVPIFKSGLQRGEYYDAARLRRMVRNSNLMRPHFRGIIKTKLTHTARQPELLHQAALGQNSRYYLKHTPDGLFVMGDFSHVPKPVADAVSQHFPNVSVEKYRHFKPGDGSCWPDVIKSVAFLGADAPEVKGLKLAYPDVFQDDPFGDIDIFHLQGEAHMLGATIKAIREELGMTPDDLASVTGLTVDELAAIENGELDPTPEQVQAIAEALGMSVDDLQAAASDTEAAASDSSAEAKFSEQDLRSMIARAIAPLKQALQETEQRERSTSAALFAERQRNKTHHIRTIITRWRKAGMPAVLEHMGLETFMEKLSDRQLETFGQAEQAEQLSPLGWFERWVETFQELGLVVERELAGDGHTRGQNDPDRLIEAYAEQHKLSYAEAASTLAKQGRITV